MADLTRTATIGVIIPVLGDAVALASLLQRITHWQDPALQVMVVAGQDDGASRRVAIEGNVHYLETAACRGRQLDVGARACGADILWFLHADAVPEAGACDDIRRAVRRGAVGGYFRFQFQGTATLMKKLLAAAINLRARFGVPYGDQGLFAISSAYIQAGGYPHQPLFEEVSLVRGLRREGRFEALGLSIGVDPRRWQRDGWLKRTLRNRWLALCYMVGAAPEKLAASYQQQHSAPRRG